MSYRHPSTPADPTHVWDHDARVLAGLLRTAPLTVLLSPPGVDTTPMLLHGVMPKLRRRASDRAPRDTATSAMVIAFADRRDSRAGLLARRDREIAVFFDAWNDDPIAALLRQVRQAVDAAWMPAVDDSTTLAKQLADLQARHNLRFLLLLDRFEDALAQRAAVPRIGAFIEQWLEALAQPELAVHFLVALPESELARFDGVRERIPDFDDRVLRANGSGRLFGLASVGSGVPPDVAAAIAASSVPAPPVDDDAFLASLSDISVRVAAAAAGGADPAPPPLPAGEGWGEGSSPAQTSNSAGPPPPGPALTPTLSPGERGQETPTRVPSFAWLLLPLIAAALWWWLGGDSPAPKLPVAALPAAPVAQVPVAQVPVEMLPPFAPPTTPPAPSLLGPAAIDIAVDPANGTDARIARELTASLAPTGGIELPALPSRGGLATLVDLDAASTSPRLAIANYDALQAARTLALRPRLAIVTPLYMQEIYFIVRADSPLRFLHDLRGARIDAGPADGSRSLTAASVYRQLFDQSLPATASTAHDEDDALAELLAFRSVDVVATVGGQPLPWLANLPKSTRDRIRLLRIDDRDPVDRRALQTFLPSTVRRLDLGGEAHANPRTLAVMSFLVTNAQPDDAAASARLTDFAKGLCAALPALRRSGHPKWAEVNPGLTLPTGFPDSAAAQAGFGDCHAAGAATPASSVTATAPPTHRASKSAPRHLHRRLS